MTKAALRTTGLRRTAALLLAALAGFGLGSPAARAQFEPQQCFDALMTGPTGLKPIAEKPGAAPADYLNLLAQNINLNVASGNPLIYVSDLWEMSQLTEQQKVDMRNTLARLRAAIGDYVIVVLASELRRVTPIFLMRDGHFVPPTLTGTRNVGSPPDRYVFEITSPTGDHGLKVPPMSLLVSRVDCKLIDLSLGDSSFLFSIGQDLKAIGDLTEAERQLRGKIAEITAAQ